MIKRVILLPDFHHPHINKPAVDAVFQFIKWFKPHAINILGDAMNMDSVDHWKESKGNKEAFEGKRIIKDYEDFDRDILTPIEKLLPKDCEKTYMGGNHEDWINTYISKNPKLKGMVEIEKCLKLKERDWEWLPWIRDNKRSIKKYGKLLVFHGQYWNKYHASKTANAFSKSCAYGHTHDIQSYTKVHIDDYRDYHTAQSIGCLCTMNPEFMKGTMNRWINAFGILYVREDDMYNLYVPVIVKGKFVFNGKMFSES